ncbi:MAG: hypothetical protein KDA21_12955 [Phycisphaerales bacterium]|nr:hypothetical protein [Phycisphaerales bacterium]
MSHESQRELIAAAVVLAAGTQAYGAAVRFDNPAGPGHFNWIERTLDLTQPAAAQPSALGDSGISSGVWAHIRMYTASDYQTIFARTARGGASPLVSGQTLEGAFETYTYVKALSAGDEVGAASGDFSDDAMMAARIGGSPYYGWYDRTDLTMYGTSYVGFRFAHPLTGMMHYGWVSLYFDPYFAAVDALAWGYETRPETPVPAGAPTPGTLAGLALGAAAFGGRRKLRKDT